MGRPVDQATSRRPADHCHCVRDDTCDRITLFPIRNAERHTAFSPTTVLTGVKSIPATLFLLVPRPARFIRRDAAIIFD